MEKETIYGKTETKKIVCLIIYKVMHYIRLFLYIARKKKKTDKNGIKI